MMEFEAEPLRLHEAVESKRDSRFPTPAERLARAALERPLRVGVLSGYGYRNRRGDLDRTSEFLRRVSRVPHTIVSTPVEVARGLDAYTDAGLDVVVVSGGDGTVSLAATHLLTRAPSRPAPVLALLEGGRTNMTALDVGVRGNQVRALQRLLRWADERTVRQDALVERPVLGVSSPGAKPMCGFFFGGGAVYQASLKAWAFQQGCKVPGMSTGLGTAFCVLRQITAHLVSRSAFAPSKVGIRVDGRGLLEDSWCVFFGTTLQRMALGIFPFWSRDRGTIRFSAIAHDHRKLLRAAKAGLRGRTNRHLTPDLGYHSFNAQRLDFDLGDGLTLDGEIVRPVGRDLKISLAGEMTFLRI